MVAGSSDLEPQKMFGAPHENFRIQEFSWMTRFSWITRIQEFFLNGLLILSGSLIKIVWTLIWNEY